jgi:hypothetical protein
MARVTPFFASLLFGRARRRCPASSAKTQRAEMAGSASSSRSKVRIQSHDDETGTLVDAAARTGVDRRILGFPVVDGDPVQLGTEVVRDLIHGFADDALNSKSRPILALKIKRIRRTS